jgi:hypothetical protein
LWGQRGLTGISDAKTDFLDASEIISRVSQRENWLQASARGACDSPIEHPSDQGMGFTRIFADQDTVKHEWVRELNSWAAQELINRGWGGNGGVSVIYKHFLSNGYSTQQLPPRVWEYLVASGITGFLVIQLENRLDDLSPNVFKLIMDPLHDPPHLCVCVCV